MLSPLSYDPMKGTVVGLFSIKYGAGDRVRTGDNQHGKLALYQLSYSRMEPTSQGGDSWAV